MAVNKKVFLRLVIVCCVIVFEKNTRVLCTRTKPIPLIGEESTVKKSAVGAECLFGKQTRELNSTWFADLGPPFGVMYCVRCECIPVQKKRRLIGKIACKNIKNDCPKPSCDEPVLPPGKCCKVCPGDEINSPDNIPEEKYPVVTNEEERNMKHFASVLTAGIDPDDMESSNLPKSTSTKNLVATGRFLFHKRNLYYSFYSKSRPKGIQFIDRSGHILEEQVFLPNSVYQNSTGKVCGAWRRIPRDFRKLLKEEKMYVTLLWDRVDLTVTGRLFKYKTLNAELFSALLEGDDANIGGTAAVTVSVTSPFVVHITVAFVGIVSNDTDGGVIVKLDWMYRKHNILKESATIKSVSSGVNIIEVSSPITSYEINTILKQETKITVETSKGKAFLSGSVVARVTCEIFHAPLSPPFEDKNSVIKTPVSGLAWMYINKYGNLRYHIHLDEMPNPDMVGLVLDRRNLELEDLTPAFKNGWANGTIDNLDIRELEYLYNNELAINVATAEISSVVRGKLIGKPMADARDGKALNLMRRHNSSMTPANISGMIWANVDSVCNLHYELVLAGILPLNSRLQLYLLQIPIDVPGAPVTKIMLQEFSSATVEDVLTGLSPYELSKLNSGIVYFEVKDASTQKSILKTQWKEVSIPQSCLPSYNENFEPPIDLNNDEVPEELTACYHSNRFHDDGSQWPSANEQCVMCSCNLGQVKCSSILCPKPACDVPVLKENQCCPICDNSTDSNSLRTCELAGQTFPAGSTWHPYVPPKGFDTCAVCKCDKKTLTISCSRVDCPKLDCDPRFTVRTEGCCKVCSTKRKTPSLFLSKPMDTNIWMGDQHVTAVRTKEDILAAGGCNYPNGGPFENGQDWHPRMHNRGEIKWVICHCKNGRVDCERLKNV